MDSGWGGRKGKGGYRHQGYQTKTGFPSPSSQKRFKMMIYWHLYNFDINFVSNVPLRSIIYYQLCILLLVEQKKCWGFEKLLPLSKPCMQHQNIASHAAEIYNQSRLVSNIVKEVWNGDIGESLIWRLQLYQTLPIRQSSWTRQQLSGPLTTHPLYCLFAWR